MDRSGPGPAPPESGSALEWAARSSVVATQSISATPPSVADLAAAAAAAAASLGPSARQQARPARQPASGPAKIRREWTFPLEGGVVHGATVAGQTRRRDRASSITVWGAAPYDDSAQVVHTQLHPSTPTLFVNTIRRFLTVDIALRNAKR